MKYNLNDLLLATEAIDFQGGSDFEKLTELFTELKEQGTPKTKLLYAQQGSSIKDNYNLTPLVSFINKRFGFNITTVKEGSWAVMLPMVKANHTLFQTRLKNLYEFAAVDPYKDVRAILSKELGGSIEGIVDGKNAKVGGIFSQIELTFLIDTKSITDDTFTAQELAAITLHECGHVFTTFDHVTKYFTTNQILLNCMAAFKQPNTEEAKRIIFTKASKDLNLDKLSQAQLMTSKTEKDVYFVFLNEGFDTNVSDMDTNLIASTYDTVSSEAVADDFAVRMGSGEYLATALSKLYTDQYKTEKSALRITIGIQIASVLFGMALGPFTASVMLLYQLLITWCFGFGFAEGSKSRIYDHPKDRLKRIRSTLIQYLKDDKLDKEELNDILAQLEVVDKKVNEAFEFTPMADYFSKIANIFSSTYRKQRAYELYQQDLETLANNKIFLQSAKLRTIALAKTN